MSDSRLLPCEEWAEKLAALHPDDLLPAEREDLRKHMSTCERCVAAFTDYRRMDSLIRRSLIIDPSRIIRNPVHAEHSESMTSHTQLQCSLTKQRLADKLKILDRKFKALPKDLKQQLQNDIVDFLVHQAKNMGDEIVEAISQLASQNIFCAAFDLAIESAIRRFIAEYTLKDTDLVTLLITDKHFWESKDVRQRLKVLIRLPDYWLVDERATIVQHFEDVLPQQVDRDRLDKAVTFFLRCIVEALWALPGAKEICRIYSLQFQKTGVEVARRQAAQLRAQLQASTELSTEVQQALLKLALALEQRLLIGPYHNLPQPDYVRFVGRQKEISWVHQCLTSGNRANHIMITGVAGSGKSALALAVAHSYYERYKDLQPEERFEAILWISATDGVSHAESGNFTHPGQFFPTLEDVYTTIARTLGRKDITRAIDKETQKHLVYKALSAQRTLLIIDNLNGIIDERVRGFLHHLPASTKYLITTQRQSNGPYEKQLKGLPLKEAEELLSEEIGATSLELSETQRRQLLWRTNRLPLSIRLSVARIASGEPFDQVIQWLDNLDNRLPAYCVEGQIELARRQKPSALLLLLACSLFDQSIGASREALGFITDISPIERDEGLALLQRLSLLNRDEDDHFWVLPIVYGYAGTELVRADVGEALTERWLNWLCNFVHNYGEELEFHIENAQTVSVEYPHVLNAIRWCREHKQWGTLLELVEGISFYPYLVNLFSELREILEAGLQASRAFHIEQYEGSFIRQIGRLLWKQGQLEKALKYLEQSKEIASRNTHTLYSQLELGRISNIRIGILFLQDHLLEAEQVAETIWERGKRLDNPELKILAAYRLAECASKKGQFSKALQWLNESEEWCKELGWSRRLAWNMYLRGAILMQQGKNLDAEQFLTESLCMAVSWNEHYLIALNKQSLTQVYREADRLPFAFQMVAEAHELYERLGMKKELEQVKELTLTLPGNTID